MRLAATEAGNGTPLVLLHGLFGSARNLGVLQRHFAKSYRTIALDLRNHGQSPHDSVMDYGVMAADVLETLAAMEALPAAVFGHSMGGKTAMAAALREPAAVASLIVGDIAPVAYEHGNQGIVAALRSLDLGRAWTRGEADQALATALPDAAVRAFLLQNFMPGERPGWRLGLAEIAAAVPALEGWAVMPGSYDGPALFIAGERSDYVTDVGALAARALFPRAVFARVSGAGHWLHAENPGGTIEAMERFSAV